MRRGRAEARGGPDRAALLLIGHGSRVPGANRLLHRVARSLRRTLPGLLVQACFLEAARPAIGEALDRCVARGARRVVFLPYLLAPGGHVSRDLPREMARARRRHPGLRLALAAHLGYDPRLVAVAADRARDVLRRRRWA